MTIILKLLKEFVLGKIFGTVEKYFVRRILNYVKYVKKTVIFALGAVVVLFIIYFWNLDQKLLGWAYKQVNLIFDRKKVNQVF